MKSPWPRDASERAAWESTTLKPLERLVALAYADHASVDLNEAGESRPAIATVGGAA